METIEYDDLCALNDAYAECNGLDLISEVDLEAFGTVGGTLKDWLNLLKETILKLLIKVREWFAKLFKLNRRTLDNLKAKKMGFSKTPDIEKNKDMYRSISMDNTLSHDALIAGFKAYDQNAVFASYSATFDSFLNLNISKWFPVSKSMTARLDLIVSTNFKTFTSNIYNTFKGLFGYSAELPGNKKLAIISSDNFKSTITSATDVMLGRISLPKLTIVSSGTNGSLSVKSNFTEKTWSDYLESYTKLLDNMDMLSKYHEDFERDFKVKYKEIERIIEQDESGEISKLIGKTKLRSFFDSLLNAKTRSLDDFQFSSIRYHRSVSNFFTSNYSS